MKRPSCESLWDNDPASLSVSAAHADDTTQCAAHVSQPLAREFALAAVVLVGPYTDTQGPARVCCTRRFTELVTNGSAACTAAGPA